MSYIIHAMSNDMNVQAALPGAQEAHTRFCIDQYARLHDKLDDHGVLRGYRSEKLGRIVEYDLVERFELLMDEIYDAVKDLTHPKPLRRPPITMVQNG